MHKKHGNGLPLAIVGGLTLALVNSRTPPAAWAQRNEKVGGNFVVVRPALLPAALAEFLDVYRKQMPDEQRVAFFKEWQMLTLAEREEKVSALYQAANRGAAPPHLVYADPQKRLGSYPKNPALDDISREHGQSVDLFYATWFPDEQIASRPGPGHPEYASELRVKADGTVDHDRRLWNWAVQGGGSGYSPAQRAEMSASIRQALKLLPPGEIPVPLDRLLIVTFRNEKGWETRLYDRSNLPLEVARLFDIANGKSEQCERPEMVVEKGH